MKVYDRCPCDRGRCQWTVETQECSPECECRVVDEDLIEDNVALWERGFSELPEDVRPTLWEWLGWSRGEYRAWISGFPAPGEGRPRYRLYAISGCRQVDITDRESVTVFQDAETEEQVALIDGLPVDRLEWRKR